MSVHETTSQLETELLAAAMAGKAAQGDVFLLDGTLGAGKSVFARAFIRTLCGEDTEVPSPTFTLVQTYESNKGPLSHFDLYRLKSSEEIFEAGWEDAVADGIVLVEWPQRLGSYRPVSAKTITIEIINETARRITIDD